MAREPIAAWPWKLHVGLDYVRIDSANGLNDVLPETTAVTESHARAMTVAPEAIHTLIEIQEVLAVTLARPYCAKIRAKIASVIRKSGIKLSNKKLVTRYQALR